MVIAWVKAIDEAIRDAACRIETGPPVDGRERTPKVAIGRADQVHQIERIDRKIKRSDPAVVDRDRELEVSSRYDRSGLTRRRDHEHKPESGKDGDYDHSPTMRRRRTRPSRSI